MQVFVSNFKSLLHQSEECPFHNRNLTTIVQTQATDSVKTTILHPTNAKAFLGRNPEASISSNIQEDELDKASSYLKPGRYYCLERPNARESSAFLSENACLPFSATTGPVIYREALVTDHGEVATRAKFFRDAQDALRYVGNEQYRAQNNDALRFDKAAVTDATILEYHLEKRREMEGIDNLRSHGRSDTLER